MTVEIPLVDAVYAAARWGGYLAAFLILGASSYAPFLFRSAAGFPASFPDIAQDLTRRAARIGFTAALVLLVLAAVRLYLQSRTLLDPEEPLSWEFLRSVLGSRWGRGWKRQAAAALLAVLGFGVTRAGWRSGWLLAAGAGAGVALTAGMTGHAVTAPAGPAGWLLDAGHFGAGGLWLGGLAVMLIGGLGACRGLGADRRSAIRLLVGDFSRRALILAPLTVALGVWLAACYLGWSWPLHLFASGYSRALAVKLGAVIVVVLLGAYNWRVRQPRLSEPDGETRFRRSGAMELSCGVLLLGITAILVALAFPEGRM